MAPVASCSGEDCVQSRNWTFAEIKAFELALARHFNDADRCVNIAIALGKSTAEVQRAYAELEDDMSRIYSGDASASSDNSAGNAKKRAKTDLAAAGQATAPMSQLPPDQQRKGVPWTTDEHRLFLLGLAKFGKGSWRSISRQFVMTRTPTQVASHAQKYFLRLNSTKERKDKRRASIHDMTTDHIGGGPTLMNHMPVRAH